MYIGSAGVVTAARRVIFVATRDETRGELGRLDQILRELALDHLVLHLLKDRVLRALQVLDQNFLAFLRGLKPVKFLDELVVLHDQLVVFFSHLLHLLRVFSDFGGTASLALHARVRVRPLRRRVAVVHRTARPVRELIVVHRCRCSPDHLLLFLLLLAPQ